MATNFRHILSAVAVLVLMAGTAQEGYAQKWRKNKKEKNTEHRIGGMEDFMTLIRVYYQAGMAANIGITNINMLPDLATFKRTLKVPTQNNKLGVGERSKCKKMLEQLYQLDDSFFKEIDSSIKKNCRKPRLLLCKMKTVHTHILTVRLQTSLLIFLFLL